MCNGEGESQVAVGGLRTETQIVGDVFATSFASVAAGRVLGEERSCFISCPTSPPPSPPPGEPWVCLNAGAQESVALGKRGNRKQG